MVQEIKRAVANCLPALPSRAMDLSHCSRALRHFSVDPSPSFPRGQNINFIQFTSSSGLRPFSSRDCPFRCGQRTIRGKGRTINDEGHPTSRDGNTIGGMVQEIKRAVANCFVDLPSRAMDLSHCSRDLRHFSVDPSPSFPRGQNINFIQFPSSSGLRPFSSRGCPFGCGQRTIKDKGATTKDEGCTIKDEGCTIRGKGCTIKDEGRTFKGKGCTIKGKGQISRGIVFPFRFRHGIIKEISSNFGS